MRAMENGNVVIGADMNLALREDVGEKHNGVNKPHGLMWTNLSLPLTSSLLGPILPLVVSSSSLSVPCVKNVQHQKELASYC